MIELSSHWIQTPETLTHLTSSKEKSALSFDLFWKYTFFYYYYYEAQIYYNGFQIPKEKLFQPATHIDNVIQYIFPYGSEVQVSKTQLEKICLKLASPSVEVICVVNACSLLCLCWMENSTSMLAKLRQGISNA